MPKFQIEVYDASRKVYVVEADSREAAERKFEDEECGPPVREKTIEYDWDVWELPEESE